MPPCRDTHQYRSHTNFNMCSLRSCKWTNDCRAKYKNSVGIPANNKPGVSIASLRVASKGLSFGTFSASGKNSGHVVSGETCWWLCCFRGFGLPQQVFEVWGLDVKHQVVHCRQTSKTWLERDFRALGKCRALSHKRPRLRKPTNLLKKGSVSSVRLSGYQPQQLCRIETSSNTHIENCSFGHNHQKIERNTTKIQDHCTFLHVFKDKCW